MLDRLPEHVKVVEVGPRDGLQNEKQPVSTEDKFRFICLLADAGIRHIELTSFVKPEAIPQLADAVELMRRVNAHNFPEGMCFSCLVPNMRGLERAKEFNVEEIAVFLAASDAFSIRNINANIEASFVRIQPVMEEALRSGMRVRGYVSTAFGCPYEGLVPVDKVLAVAARLLDMGAYEISLGDTIGIANPLQVRQVLDVIAAHIPAEKLAMHFHDTYGMAVANILTALEMGITAFDASAGGLGGCPYAKGASGNVATEDVLHLLHSMHIDTGVQMEKLVKASQFVLNKLGKESLSKSHHAFSK